LKVPAGQPAFHGAKLRLASQAVLLALIIAFITTPLILTVWRYHSPERFDSHPWLANLT
jgi:predicted cobalt transporter CbtA